MDGTVEKNPFVQRANISKILLELINYIEIGERKEVDGQKCRHPPQNKKNRHSR
jgi:hypothetical protein